MIWLTSLGQPIATPSVVVRHVGRCKELLHQPPDGVGVGAHAPLFHYHVALLVEFARNNIVQPPALEPRPQFQPVFRHRPEILGLVEPRLGIQSVCAVALRHLGELVRDDVLLRFVLRLDKCLVQLFQLLRVAPHGFKYSAS